MDILIKALQLILSLSILVVLHEMGHFLPAKWFKTKVEKFYLFFNPGFSLFKKQIGETEYGVGWLPLGGYVKIAGMIDESMDKEFLESEPEPWEFRSKPAWQRLIIMLGGVTINIILGYFIFSMIAFVWGSSYIPTTEVKDGIYVDTLGYEMGLRTGDKILRIGEKDFERFSPSALIQGIVLDDARNVKVIREGAEVDIPIDEKYVKILTGDEGKKTIFNARIPFTIAKVAEDSPAEKAGLTEGVVVTKLGDQEIDFYDQYIYKARENRGSTLPITFTDENGNVTTNDITISKDGTIGVYAREPASYFDLEVQEFSFVQSFDEGIRRGNDFVSSQLNAFGKIFRGKIRAKDSLGSFLSIGNMFPSTWDWRIFWNMTAMLSLILGILNLLPIPGLDGGHVMFLIWEVVTGRKVSDKVVEYATMVGFVILILLMVFALGNDIRRFWPF